MTLETRVPGLEFVRLVCEKPEAWTFDLKAEEVEKDVAIIKIKMTAPTESAPPKFAVRLGLSGVRADHTWSAFDDRYQLYAVGFGAESRYVCGEGRTLVIRSM